MKLIDRIRRWLYKPQIVETTLLTSDDLVLLCLPGYMPQKQIAETKEKLKSLFPENRVGVLAGEAKLVLIKKVRLPEEGVIIVDDMSAERFEALVKNMSKDS